LNFVKCSPYQKIFQTKVADINGSYMLYY